MGEGGTSIFEVEGAINYLRAHEALGWTAQLFGLACVLSFYCVLLLIACRIGRRNTADLNDENDELRKKVAESNVKRRELRDQKKELEEDAENLQAQRPEERLLRAAKEREYGNEERAIQLYHEILGTFGPDLARCCEALAAEDGTEVERFRTLAAQLADIGAQ